MYLPQKGGLKRVVTGDFEGFLGEGIHFSLAYSGLEAMRLGMSQPVVQKLRPVRSNHWTERS